MIRLLYWIYRAASAFRGQLEKRITKSGAIVLAAGAAIPFLAVDPERQGLDPVVADELNGVALVRPDVAVARERHDCLGFLDAALSPSSSTPQQGVGIWASARRKGDCSARFGQRSSRDAEASPPGERGHLASPLGERPARPRSMQWPPPFVPRRVRGRRALGKAIDYNGPLILTRLSPAAEGNPLQSEHRFTQTSPCRLIRFRRRQTWQH